MPLDPLHHRILCVDSNASYLRLYLRELEPRGYIVDVVTTGTAALASLGVRVYDLVCLAVDLPDLTAAEILHRLQSELGPSAVPVIVTTPQPLGDAVQLFGQYRTVVLLRKPFSGSRLAKLAGRLIAQDRPATPPTDSA